MEDIEFSKNGVGMYFTMRTLTADGEQCFLHLTVSHYDGLIDLTYSHSRLDCDIAPHVRSTGATLVREHPERFSKSERKAILGKLDWTDPEAVKRATCLAIDTQLRQPEFLNRWKGKS